MWPPHTHHGVKRVPLPPWRLPRTQHPGPTMTQHKTWLTWEPHSQDCSYSKGREKSPRLGASHTGGHRGLVTTERVDHAKEPAGPRWPPLAASAVSRSFLGTGHGTELYESAESEREETD